MLKLSQQRLVLAIVFVAMVVVAYLGQVLIGGEPWVYVANLAARGCLVLVVAIPLWRTTDPKHQQIWGILLLATVLDSLASAIFSYSTLTQGKVTQPIFAPLGDLLQLAAYVAVAIGLMAMREQSRPIADWRVPVLDAAVIVIALSTIAWLLVLGNISAGVELGGWANFLLQLGYPFLDFTLLVCLLIVRSRPNPVVSGSLLRGVSIFVLSVFVGDGLIGVGFYLADTYQMPVLMVAGAFQSLALGALGVTALIDHSNATPSVTEDDQFIERSWHLSSAAVAALFLVALYFLGRNLALAREVLSIEMVVLVSMVVTGLMLVVRQTVSGSRIRQALEALVLERTEKLNASTLALEASNRSLRSLTDHAPIAICARTTSGRVHYENAVWQALAKICPSIVDWQPSSDSGLQELDLATLDGETRHFYGGQSDYIDGAGRVGGQWLMLSDVTEQKLREAQLFNLSKLASLGEMATGVAHEMNQPLHALRLSLYNLQRQISRPDFGADLGVSQQKLAEKFERMDDLVARCDGLVKQMRTFGKAPSTELVVTQLHDVASEAMLLFVEQLRLKDIALVSTVDPAAWVWCSPQQLEQVLINLLANARDAVADSPTKTIRLETQKQPDHWLLRVIDTGSGIDDAIKNRLFEPFFTTKEVNQGTGLGLSISFGMINEMGGVLSLENSAHGGAVATITLPAAEPIDN